MAAVAELGAHHQNPFWYNKHSQQKGNLPMDEDEDEDEYEYHIIEAISSGSYGVVHRALNKKTNKMVAMKEELEGLSPTTIAEIETLEALGPHPCIVAFERVAMPGDGDRVYVVMECMKSDLKRWREQSVKPYPLNAIKYIMEEILKGVAFLHDNGVVHRDLKPANVLIGYGEEIKICDFGLSARFRDGSARFGEGPARSRVGTLPYMAPELLHGSRASYACGPGVDMWSVGCIMAELVADRVFFRGISNSDADQLDCIRTVVKPRCSFLRQKMAAAAECSEAAAALTPAGLDLLERLLAYETEKRITAREALDHPWFSEITYN